MLIMFYAKLICNLHERSCIFKNFGFVNNLTNVFWVAEGSQLLMLKCCTCRRWREWMAMEKRATLPR
jgi:hypothetical protein